MTVEPEVAKCFFICTAVVLTAWAVCWATRGRSSSSHSYERFSKDEDGPAWKWGQYPTKLKKGGKDDC